MLKSQNVIIEKHNILSIKMHDPIYYKKFNSEPEFMGGTNFAPSLH